MLVYTDCNRLIVTGTRRDHYSFTEGFGASRKRIANKVRKEDEVVTRGARVAQKNRNPRN